MSVLSQVSASCPKVCRCPRDAPRCAAGVSLLLDGCGCCAVCARQLFEDCSKTQPCDHTKGLECNFGGRYGSAKGICRGTTSPDLFPFFFMNVLSFSFQTSLLFSVSLKQPNQMEEHASTTTRFTRTGKSSVQTANTSAPAWTVLLDASLSAHISSCCPNWAVPSPSGSRYRGGAVNKSSAPRRRRQRAPW